MSERGTFFRLLMYIKICYKIAKLQLVCYGIIHSTVVILHSYKLNYFINQRVIIITKKRLYLTLALLQIITLMPMTKKLMFPPNPPEMCNL